MGDNRNYGMTEPELLLTLEKLRQAFDLSPEAMAIISLEEGIYTDVNQTFLDTLGYGREEVVGQAVAAADIWASPAEREQTMALLTSGQGRVRGQEIVYVDREGKRRTGLWSADIILIGGKRCLLWSLLDITDRKEREENLRKIEEHFRHTSLHDALTSLYNRAYFEEEMRRLDNGREEIKVALIACDVDGLKLVNDIMGHAEGDRVLKAVAGVMEKSFRYGDVVARLGGDEFAALVAPATRTLAVELCGRVVKEVELYNQQTSGIPLGLSVGYALRTGSGTTLAEVYRDADSAMYRDKMQHRKQYRQSLLRAMALGAEKAVYPALPEEHIERMKMVINILAREMKLSRKRTEMVNRLAEFHDIGMVGLSDVLLTKKPEELTREDRELLKQHCDNGYRIASIVPELNSLAEGILAHHERWDGGGYPKGLKEHKIPVESRIIAIADAFSAMTCPRSYRASITVPQAIMELQNGAGTQFDPHLTNKFIAAYQRGL